MRLISIDRCKRRGAIAPLTAILCIVLLACVAFAVDLAWMVLAETELQSAADAAALAAANELLDPYVQYQLSGQSADAKKTIHDTALTAARATAKRYAGYNGAGEKNTLSLRDEDIEFGFLDELGAYSTTYTGFPNTVKVTVRRDRISNGALPLFFAPALGTSNASLNATASASLYAGVVDGLQSYNGLNIGLLPMTFDVDHWDEFLKTGKDADGNSSVSSSGIPQLQVYTSDNTKGNFGQLALDDIHAGSSEIKDWINNGLTQAQLDLLISRGLIPLSARGVGLEDWLGNPGLKASTIQEVNLNVGKEYVLPLFKAHSTDPYEAGVGAGSHYDYNIVRFVGIKIMPPTKDNKDITVMPSAVIDPALAFSQGTVAPAGTSVRFESTFTVPRLSR